MSSRRAAILALLAMPLGYFKAFAAEKGRLTINLDQWQGIDITHQGRTLHVTAAEIFAALKG